VRIDEQTENPFDRDTDPEKHWRFESMKKQEIQKSRRRIETHRRIGKTKFHEVLGKLVWNAYPDGAIFDINTGQLVHFSERPGLFIRVAAECASREADDWMERRANQR